MMLMVMMNMEPRQCRQLQQASSAIVFFIPRALLTIRRLLVAQLITFVILVFFAQALLSGSQ